jgi:hypothetical protein
MAPDYRLRGGLPGSFFSAPRTRLAEVFPGIERPFPTKSRPLVSCKSRLFASSKSWAVVPSNLPQSCLFALGGALDAFECAIDLAARPSRHLAPFLLSARFEGAEMVARIADDAREASPRFLARGFDLLLDRIEIAAQLA